jgi:hypothetical protein
MIFFFFLQTFHINDMKVWVFELFFKNHYFWGFASGMMTRKFGPFIVKRKIRIKRTSFGRVP